MTAPARLLSSGDQDLGEACKPVPQLLYAFEDTRVAHLSAFPDHAAFTGKTDQRRSSDLLTLILKGSRMS